MKDSELAVLEQYDIEVNNTRKVRGACLCDTSRGLMLLKEAGSAGRKIPLLSEVSRYLKESGCPNVDEPIANKEGELISTAEDGERYVLKRWFSGRECDVKKEYEIVEAIKNLGYLHNILQEYPVQESGLSPVDGEKPWEEAKGHNQELKKVRAFIRRCTAKSEFEMTFLKYFDRMYETAEEVARRLDQPACYEVWQHAKDRRSVTHGDYNYHNILMLGDGIATVNFDNCRIDAQVADVYYFIRKIMEKHQWNIRFGEQLLRSYSLIHPLTEDERTYLALRLAYPEKFFKSANTYYQSNKAKIPGKSVEKLLLSVQETDRKKQFLEQIFSFHL